MVNRFQFSEVLEILKNSIYITGLVIIMMLVIEYINVATKGRKLNNLQKSPAKQILLGAALGLIPGCMGGFAAVSLFSHNVFNFGGLIAAMISDTGDETFVMFAAIPGYAVLIKVITFSLAIAVGFAVNAFMVKKNITPVHFDHNLQIHDTCGHHTEKATASIWYNLKHLSVTRILILAGILAFMVSLGLGLLEHDHSAHELPVVHTEECTEHEHIHSSDCDHDHGHDHDHVHNHDHGHSHSHSNIFSERWLNILFIFVAFAAFLMVLSVTEHFLKEHILHHVIYKHLLRVFLWTFGSLLFIYVLGLFVNYEGWISENQIIMLLIAIVIGIIPQSGPHILFISLFISGAIPFSILLANSVVQNGHSGLPLLAESKKSFINMKLISMLVGLLVGIAGYLFGF